MNKHYNMVYYFIIMFNYCLVGFLLCHQHLVQNESARELWEKALQNNYVTLLCRDEILHTHLYIISFFESIRG